MAQWAQLQPQEDLPCCFCRTKDRTIRPMTAIRTRQINVSDIMMRLLPPVNHT